MKRISHTLRIILIALICFNATAQEKKIKFNKGTLRICSAKNFQITGYDGNEVIVKSLHEKQNYRFGYTTKKPSKVWLNNQGTKTATTIGRLTNRTKPGTVTYYFRDEDKKKGLKKLGKKNENKELGIYFTIEQKDGELVFSDPVPSATGALVMYGNESYEVKIPNSLKVVWETNGCVIMNQSSKKARATTLFYNSNPSSLTDFDGEVDIKSSLSNIKLVDVTGPVSINTIGGNVTVAFDKRKPTKLYSIYSNNGFIDVTLPTNSSLSLDVIGESIYSDLDMNILEESEVDDFGHIKTKMKLKQGSGKVRMKLDAGYGSIYLRKKK